MPFSRAVGTHLNQTNLKEEKYPSKHNKKRLVIYFIVLVTVMVSIGLYMNTKNDIALRNYELTTATITDFGPCNYSYCLKYVYEVNGKKYKSFVSTEYFSCDDGTKGCLGKQFPLKYSIDDPKISRIDLGKYNDHKLTKPTLEHLIEN